MEDAETYCGTLRRLTRARAVQHQKTKGFADFQPVCRSRLDLEKENKLAKDVVVRSFLLGEELAAKECGYFADHTRHLLLTEKGVQRQ